MKRLITTLCLLLASFGAYANQCIPSGVTDQGTFFVAVDATDFTTRETGLSSFTVYRARDVNASAAMTTPTVVEIDATNQPGVYRLLLDEDTTVTAGNDVEHMVFTITHAGMAPVTKEICLARAKITAGETLTVASGIGDASVEQWDDTPVAVPTTAGVPEVDVTHWLGTASATPTVAGVPEVDITHFGGTAGTFASGRPNVNTSHVAGTSQTGGDLAALITTADSVIDNVLSYIQTNLGLLGANATEAGGNGDHLTEAGGTGDQFTGQPWNANWDVEVQSEATDALNAYDPPTNTEMTTAIDALPTAAENATEHLTQQRVLTGTCDSGSTTTCVDNALTQANTSQLDDRLICFSDSWCALITDFTPGTDTVTTTKVAPATRGSLGYTIFPATAQ